VCAHTLTLRQLIGHLLFLGVAHIAITVDVHVEGHDEQRGRDYVRLEQFRSQRRRLLLDFGCWQAVGDGFTFLL
jgi:hypothetical protein